MTDNEKRAHDFAMAVVQNYLAKKEKYELLDLIAEYNISYDEMFKQLDSQNTKE